MAAHLLSGLGPVLSSSSSQSVQAPYRPTSNSHPSKLPAAQHPNTPQVAATNELKAAPAAQQGMTTLPAVAAQPALYPACFMNPYSWVPAGGYPWAYYHQYAYQQYINYHKSFHLNMQPLLPKSPTESHRALMPEAGVGGQLEFVAVGGDAEQTTCGHVSGGAPTPPTLIPEIDRSTSVTPTHDSQADECLVVKVPPETTSAQDDAAARLGVDVAGDDGFQLDGTLGWPDGTENDLLTYSVDDMQAGDMCLSDDVLTGSDGLVRGLPDGSKDADFAMEVLPRDMPPQSGAGDDSAGILDCIAKGAVVPTAGAVGVNPLLAQLQSVQQARNVSNVVALAHAQAAGRGPAAALNLGIGAVDTQQFHQMMLSYHHLMRTGTLPPPRRKEIVTHGIAALAPRGSANSVPQSAPLPTSTSPTPTPAMAADPAPQEPPVATAASIDKDAEGATRHGRRHRHPSKPLYWEYDYDPRGVPPTEGSPPPPAKPAVSKPRAKPTSSNVKQALKVTVQIQKKAKRPNQSPARYKSGGPCCNPGCLATTSPQWRRGPDYAPTLCNACGTRWARNGTFDLTSNGKVKRKPAGAGTSGHSRQQRAAIRMLSWTPDHVSPSCGSQLPTPDVSDLATRCLAEGGPSSLPAYLNAT